MRVVESRATRAMPKVSLLLLLVTAAGSRTLPLRSRLPRRRSDDRVFGGDPVDIEQYPWQLSLQAHGKHECGASVIKSRWALTTAQCVFRFFLNELSVRAGTSTRDSGGTVYDVEKSILHSEYRYTRIIDYDVAVIQIVGSFSFSSTVQPVNLATSEPTEGTLVTITGWGSTVLRGQFSDQLHAAKTSIVSRHFCQERYSLMNVSVTENMICTLANDRDICIGDYGGPLVVDNTQYGIASYQLSCGFDSFPAVYTNVVALQYWITDNTGSL